ncbi:hypothetical protein NLU13_2093 [Sarocladium strictum]|uniref:Uncharacterized protein n=1 Tax=Sarocladium strictum TaxID=5046 RepID=A0AA39LCU6_SARSR|nr:hypothetical protein NLU13_2093 [Sarocladium strictum]
MSHPYLLRASLVPLGIFFAFGVNGMLNPNGHLRALHFPLHTETTAQKLNHALMRIWGIRNISVAYLFFLLWSTGDEVLMARGLLAGLAIAVTDGFVSRALTGGNELMHWGTLPVVGGIAAGVPEAHWTSDMELKLERQV